MARVHPDKLQALRAVLEAIDEETVQAMRGETLSRAIVPFHNMQTVHYARFALLERDTRLGPMLAFSTNYDGPEGEDDCGGARALDHHLDDMVRHAEAGLRSVFSHCEGNSAHDLKAFLRRNQLSAKTFYVGSSGRSLNQIRWEEQLRRRVGSILDVRDFSSARPEVVRAAIVDQLKEEGVVVPRFPPQPDLTGNVTRLKVGVLVLGIALLAGTCVLVATRNQPWPVAVGVALGVWVILPLLLVGYFWRLEKTDPPFQIEYSPEAVAHFRVAAADENRFLQNPLTHWVTIKPGILRCVIIRVVVAVLQFLARNQYNNGKLGEIPSIHFARWVLIPHRGVLFFSNFDSSWQSYLGDFIDKASSGLTAVWSNTVGYPRTKWLTTAGSRDAARFLAWTRHHQIPTQVWYSAYPGLSIVNINSNTEIRRGLADPDALDAATWLFHLRSVDRAAADNLYSDERTREPPLAKGDIQGLILWGYGHMPDARYLMFRVEAPHKDLRRWIGQLPLASGAGESLVDGPAEPLVNIAFTHQGLLALGLDESTCARFAAPFVQGSHDEYRSRVNGDVGDDDPRHWSWGGPNNPVDLVLLIFASDKNNAERFAQVYIDEGARLGLRLVANLEGTTLNDRKEHFGFRDGIAQPILQGSGRAEVDGNTIAAGEVLLGHKDGYGNISHSPQDQDGFAFGMNGSYLVFRQLEQDVEAFWRSAAQQNNVNAIRMASKMLGRWPSGAPLVRHPEADPNQARFADDNDFSYLADDDSNDRYGARCPMGAHIRRANPRDWQLGATREESLELSNRHRILRRGRPYGPPLVDSMAPGELLNSALATNADAERPSRGLQFLCFNANIERQFEFIQQQWLNNPLFAGQSSGVDPLVGIHQPAQELGTEPPTFTIQSDVKSGVCPRKTQLQRFVRVVGSGYFFMPSIPAVRLFASDRCSAPDPSAVSWEDVEPDEPLHIDNLIENLREKMKKQYQGGQTLRDAHPKMHGCVQAWFKIADNIEPSLRHGLFAKPGAYKAFVRFSNAAGTVDSDRKKDIRGFAIKVLGVPGFKLLEGEEDCTSQDFLLISHNAFITPNVAGFDALVAALFGGGLKKVAYLLGNPRTVLRTLSALKHHDSLLDIPYFSATPYLLGDNPIKYGLRPTQAVAAPVSDAQRAPFHSLRDDLKGRVRAGNLSFDFMVQPRTHTSKMPIEDASVVWSESVSPFQKVATLEIPAQDFDTPERQELGENLSFNPWRCLPEHRPLGGINRARRSVYRTLSSFRHDRNGVSANEPTDW